MRGVYEGVFEGLNANHMDTKNGHFLDLDAWPRRAQYEFFRGFESPFFNICTEIPVGATLDWCREREQSFALACWFLCQRAVNLIEPFRYRLRDERVWVHDRVRVATTSLNPDETFRFNHFAHQKTFSSFLAEAKRVLAGTQQDVMDARPEDDATIYGSTLPWIRFTSVAHARQGGDGDSVPKIAFGKYGESATGVSMPVSVEVHHALMDGLHVARFLEQIEQDFADPSEVLAS